MNVERIKKQDRK